MTSGAGATAGVWAPERRRLTAGLVLTITLVAFESLAISTVMPTVEEDLGGLALYGWVFSGFFLASLAGIVVSGLLIDRRGPALPYLAGLGLFAAGLVAGGTASSMGVLVAARLAQGFGAGAIPASAYASVARGYPAPSRPRVFAVFSTAWVIPGLVGPPLATFVEHAASWRWVFGGLLPLVAVAGVMTVPSLRGLRPPADEVEPWTPALARTMRRRLAMVGLLILGVGAVLAAGSSGRAALAVVLVVVGLPLAVASFLRLVPNGTIGLRAGLPATIAVRGLLTWAFFGCDAYISLAVAEGRGGNDVLPGVVLTVTAITWTTGSWIQERLVHRVGPRRLVRTGFTVILAGAAGMAVVALALPAWVAVLAWGVGGFGMGLAYAPLSLSALAAAEPNGEGAATAALQLCDTLGVSIGTGLGGALVALADHRDWTVDTGVGLAFALGVVLAALGLVAARRLAVTLPEGPTGV